MSDKDNPSFIQGGTPRTVLFANSSISGKLSYNLPVKIDGHFTGEIKSTELLVIGANAQVDAHISARQVHLEGRLVGSVQTMGCFELLPGGYFKGEARVGELRIHSGATFDGHGNVLGRSENKRERSAIGAVKSRCFARPFTQVVKFCPANFAARNDFDFVDSR